MAPAHKFTVTYDGRIVREAVRAFVWRRCFRDQRAVWVVEVALLLFLLWRHGTGHHGWLEGIVTAVVLMPPLLVLLVWIRRYRLMSGRLHRMRAPQARFVFDQRDIFASSDLGERLIPWDRISEVWRRPESWMVFTDPDQFIILPTNQVPPEALGYLRRNLPTV